MDVSRVETDDRDLLSAVFCPSIPTLVKPDSLLHLNAVWTITQHGRGRQSLRKEEWCWRSRRIIILLPHCKCAGEGDGGGGRRNRTYSAFRSEVCARGGKLVWLSRSKYTWLSSSNKVCKSAVSEALIILFCNEDE